jgi:hypothetical protein
MTSPQRLIRNLRNWNPLVRAWAAETMGET